MDEQAVNVKKVVELISAVFKANPELFVQAKLELLAHDIDTSILITHCFKLHPETLELIKNIVYTKKLSGHSEYTQTMALYDAVSLLGSTMKVLERPQEIKDIERKRSAYIKQGKLRLNKPEQTSMHNPFKIVSTS